MNLPGFTAEASLYKSSKTYQMTLTSASLSNSSEVIPQRYCYRRGCLFCCCYDGGYGCNCVNTCIE
jgi:hypothetical protein